MSLNVMLSLEDIVEQLGKYKTQLVNTENAVQQIKGAIATCEHQMQLLVRKQNEHVLKKASEEKQPEDNISDCVEQGQQEQQQEEQVA